MHRSISIPRRVLATASAVALLAALAPGAAAQQRAGLTTLYPGQPRVSVGARAGLSYATLSGDAVEAGYRPGFVGGLTATVNVNPLVALQLEALYSQKGASFDDDDGVSPFGLGEQEVRLTSVEVPVLLRLNVPTRSSARPYLYAGPSFDVNLSADREFDDGTVGDDDDLVEDDDFEDFVQGTTVNMVVGGGLDVRFPVAGKVTLDARYAFGLTDVFDEDAFLRDELLGDDALDAKSGAFQVTLGFGL